MGGGAQVGQVAIGAISEADRHNIRGEHISVDTIPLVGEQPLADAVRAVARLPRARALVLAGSLMGGEIENGGPRSARPGAAGDQPEYGGQRPGCGRSGGDRSRCRPGVMAVMAVADTAKFTLERLEPTGVLGVARSGDAARKSACATGG